MLVLMLADQFHPWILGSGIALTVMALVRAALLRRSRSGAGHERCGHDHDHERHHAPPCPAHGHQDHEWAPWRYVVILLPIILVLLGFPNKGPEVRAAPVNVDMTLESAGYAALIGNVDPWQRLIAAATLVIEPSFEPAIVVDFKTLEMAPHSKEERDFWKGKRVRVWCQFAPSPTSERVFNLLRYRMRCCPGDAIPIFLPAACKENLSGIEAGQWIDVTGRVSFRHVGGGRYLIALQVAHRQAIVFTAPDPNPYIR
jgi:hypothetical protein